MPGYHQPCGGVDKPYQDVFAHCTMKCKLGGQE